MIIQGIQKTEKRTENIEYAMRNKFPREIHIRFTKKIIKTQILQVARKKTLKFKDKEIVVLKQLPRRDMRREYLFLNKEYNFGRTNLYR
uniref:Uncharacterized protein n=1 Tax=Laticauda laticaudata TaxID=8630 RepID=A0A8C5SIT9_LATLA